MSGWLNQPDISAEQRAKRGLAEQLYNAYELRRLQIVPDAQQRVDKWRAVAAAHGWATTRERDGKAVVGGERRPHVNSGITQLVTGDQAAPLIGHTEWCYLSAVGHATLYGLFEAVLERPGLDVAGRSFSKVGTKPSSALTHAPQALRWRRIVLRPRPPNDRRRAADGST